MVFLQLGLSNHFIILPILYNIYEYNEYIMNIIQLRNKI